MESNHPIAGVCSMTDHDPACRRSHQNREHYITYNSPQWPKNTVSPFRSATDPERAAPVFIDTTKSANEEHCHRAKHHAKILSPLCKSSIRLSQPKHVLNHPSTPIQKLQRYPIARSGSNARIFVTFRPSQKAANVVPSPQTTRPQVFLTTASDPSDPALEAPTASPVPPSSLKNDDSKIDGGDSEK